MIKKIIFIIFLINMLVLSGCTEINRNVHDEGGGNNSAEKKETSEYEVFSTPIFYTSDYDIFGELIVRGVSQYEETVKDKFEVVLDENGEFPDELVSKIEEAIYYSLDYEISKRLWNEDEELPYYKLLLELNADDFYLDLKKMYEYFPQIIEKGFESEYDAYQYLGKSESCFAMFRYSIGQKERYITAVDNGGSNGAATIYVSELKEDVFSTIYKFEVQNSGYGSVIQYEDDFYYIYMHYNYNLKNYDGVQIFKLGEYESEGNLMIKYLPKEYNWKNVYWSDAIYRKPIEEYVESMKDIIVGNEYLEIGQVGNVSVIYGDETEVTHITSTDEQYYAIDFANIGNLIYMKKANLIPSNSHSTWCLRADFYLYDEASDYLEELKELKVDENGIYSTNIVQLWFKEIGGKIFTFRIVHISDYNYVLDVLLIEGNEIIEVRKDILVPQREFVLYEGVDKFS